MLKEKAKIGQILRSLCKTVQQLDRNKTPLVMAELTIISYDYDKHLCH